MLILRAFLHVWANNDRRASAHGLATARRVREAVINGRLVVAGVLTIAAALTSACGDPPTLPNGWQDSTAITVGERIGSAFNLQDDTEVFHFGALPGKIYSVDIVEGSLPGLNLTLYDPTGDALRGVSYMDWAVGRVYGPGTGFTWKSPDEGRYYLEVSYYREDDVQSGLSYSLVVGLSDLEDDHADGYIGATPLVLGRATPGSLEYAGDHDCFSFRPVAGQLYLVRALLDTLPRAEMRLYEGTPGSGGGIMLASSSSLGPWVVWQAANSTEHYFGVIEAFEGMASYIPPMGDEDPCDYHTGGGTDGGTYTLTVAELQIEDDHANAREFASSVNTGDIVNGSLDYARDVDYFRFRGEPGATYTILYDRRTLEEASITLSNSVHKRLDEVSTWYRRDEGQYSFSMELTATSSDSYFVGVSNPYDDTGTYTLRVVQGVAGQAARLPPPIPTPPAPAPTPFALTPAWAEYEAARSAGKNAAYIEHLDRVVYAPDSVGRHANIGARPGYRQDPAWRRVPSSRAPCGQQVPGSAVQLLYCLQRQGNGRRGRGRHRSRVWQREGFPTQRVLLLGRSPLPQDFPGWEHRAKHNRETGSTEDSRGRGTSDTNSRPVIRPANCQPHARPKVKDCSCVRTHDQGLRDLEVSLRPIARYHR